MSPFWRLSWDHLTDETSINEAYFYDFKVEFYLLKCFNKHFFHNFNVVYEGDNAIMLESYSNKYWSVSVFYCIRWYRGAIPVLLDDEYNVSCHFQTNWISIHRSKTSLPIFGCPRFGLLSKFQSDFIFFTQIRDFFAGPRAQNPPVCRRRLMVSFFTMTPCSVGQYKKQKLGWVNYPWFNQNNLVK